MLILRSLAYKIAFYANTVLQMIFWTPYYFLAPRLKAWFIPKFWARSNLWLLKVIVGTESRFEGLENLPDGPFILAPKHQSTWDTLSLFPFLKDPVYILKRELMWIPLFGWYVGKMQMIPIDRGARSRALKKAMAIGRERMAAGRQLIIYPEGTRRPAGAEPVYKWGIVELYAALNVPVVPVVHHAGLFWPRRKFHKYPGTIVARFLPPIEPGLEKQAFLDRLVAEMETASDALLVEIATGPNPPPLTDLVRKRLAELGVDVAGGRN